MNCFLESQLIRQLSLEQHRFKLHRSTCICRYFSINMHSTVNVSSLHYDFNNSFFSVAYCTVRIKNIIHIAYNICANQLFILLVKLLLNRRPIVKFWRDSKVILRFLTAQGSVSLTPVLFKGQL